MFFGTGQVFWPDICPGQASRGQGCKRQWTFLLRNKRLVEAIRGQIRFWANVFLEPAKYFGQIYALVRPLEVKGASADGLFLSRNKRLVEAIRGQIRFWANVFWNRPSILARYMPW